MPRFDSLQEWLAWQELLHPRQIDLGLQRMAAVASAMGIRQPDIPVITIAGTNGKGSSAALLESIFHAAGYRTGCYTSPHLLHYNERIRIDTREIDDDALCQAFAVVDQARADITLSYFEFGTLAALELFRRQALDVLILEVGLGGRLDAVNLLDADVALVTSIGLDHTEWLGPDRESIGREKGGIFRSGAPAVCADPDPPASLEQLARELKADWLAAGRDYHWSAGIDRWDWQGRQQRYSALPLPALAGRHQLANAAGVIQVVECLQDRLPVTVSGLQAGLRQVRLAGRCHYRAGLLLDVAHNPHGAAALAHELRQRPVRGMNWLILGMLAGKDVAGFTGQLADCIDHWCLATLPGPRGLTARELARCLGDQTASAAPVCYDSVAAAVQDVRASAATDDRILVSGSFVTVAEALACQV